ncbi:4'-phosphopantetheinyl transferase superfamily protein [Danxiaibacter flavus]|uniref:4'-phosphopantetheinyl transferase superfamily protein n=1 Tax=Danxiaibacter flavus TaxID=3049108 RepID=A0ABV3ZE41_9BACT|nr:4'-phosphopantetheinyl transferase superfamily protein [Chitinophagaceae bacterium DXS]
MISVGNDIISLKSIDATRTKQARFYSKFLTQEEVDLYDETFAAILPFEHFAWLLWSVKESVYKCHKRNNTELIFSPKKIIIEQVDLPKGQPVVTFTTNKISAKGFNPNHSFECIAVYDEISFRSRSLVSNEFIHSVVTNGDGFMHIQWGISRIKSYDYAFQHLEVRELTLKQLKELFPSANLQINKNQNGIPDILIDDNKSGMPLSFSHHEQFIAYCFVSAQGGVEHATSQYHLQSN